MRKSLFVSIFLHTLSLGASWRMNRTFTENRASRETDRPTRVVLMTFQRCINGIEKHFVGDRSDDLTCFVEMRQDTRTWLFNEITDNLIIEVIDLENIIIIVVEKWSRRKNGSTDMLPSDVLVLVFLLFLFENKSDEQLLQFLIAIIDTQLLKTRRTNTNSWRIDRCEPTCYCQRFRNRICREHR
jgi:hypothetical protein